ncbi:MAG: serine/threonine protein kinase [bacterium]|nr:serine/threonine protein kinase [bacterium]
MTEARDRFNEVRELFLELAELTPEAREERLAEMEPSVADELRALLSADEDPEPAFDAPLFRVATNSTSYTEGDKLGRYTLEKRLGEGGMGTVYLARQSEPMERVVALKVISAGISGQEVVLRFEAERNALARMDHKNIAKVLEADSTEAGLPYFVMDYVAGPPITTYCDDKKLGIEARLKLFGEVCAAIEHAHQKGIVHRDIKPSNILVGEESGHPSVKVIDFGIAKAIERRPDQPEVTKRFPAVIGTPAYMSPEQAAARDMDTRTDVYSLGVVLYELLTGFLPHDPEELHGLPPEEIRRKVKEGEPETPSRRFSKADGALASEIAARRSIDFRRLLKRLQGELDWIVMKALHKDLARRYSSPSDLRRDLERHLKSQPVEAGPDDSMYRMKKFIQRYRLRVSVAAIALVGVLVFAASMAWFAARVSQERDRANREARSALRTVEVLEGLFNTRDPFLAQDSNLDTRDVLASTVAKLDEDSELEPDVHARLLKSLAVVYRNLGLLAEAEPLMEKSLNIREKLFGELHKDTLESVHELANIYLRWGKLKEAEPLQKRAVKGRREVLGEQHLLTLESTSNLGVLYLHLRDFEKAQRYFHEAYTGYRDQIGSDALETLVIASNLGQVLQNRGDMEGAEPLVKEVLSGYLRAVGEDHPWTIIARNNLGFLHFRTGELDAAESEFRKAVASARTKLGPDHPHTVTFLGNLGDTLTSLGRPDEGLPFLEETVETARTAPQVGPVALGRSLRKLGRCLMALKRYDEAETVLKEARELLVGSAGPDHPYTQKVVENLAELYEQTNRPEEASMLRNEPEAASE